MCSDIVCDNESMMERRASLGIIVLVVLAVLGSLATVLFVSGVFDRSDTLTVAVSRLEATTLVRVAEDQGYFADRGLDVTFIEDDLGKFSLKRVLEGEADLATAAEFPVVAQSFKRDDVKLLGTIHASGLNIRLLMRRDAGVVELADLAGKRIATTTGTVGEYFLSQFLEGHGVSDETVEVVNLTPLDMNGAIDERRIDGFSLREPHVYRVEQRLQDDVIVFPQDPTEVVYVATFNLVSTDDVLEKKSEDIRLFLEALKEAEAYVADNPASTQRLIADDVGIDATYLADTWDDSTFELYLDRDLVDTMQAEGFWRLEKGLATGGLPNMEDVVDPTLLLEVDPTSVRL